MLVTHSADAPPLPLRSQPESIGQAARWCARAAIETMAWGVGVAALPAALGIVGVAKVLRRPSRVVADNVLDGSVPVLGPPVARTLDRLLAA